MFKKITKFIIYFIELILAIIFISIGLKWFLIYAFMVLMIGLDKKIDYLRKLIRVFQVANETKLIAIQRKLKITDKEINAIAEENLGYSTEEQNKSLEKDIQDLLKN